MRIELRDLGRRRIGRIELDPAIRPTRVSVIERGVPEPEREYFLDWDTALDDAGRLRRCVACGCTDLFKEKAFPQVTGFVVVLAFVGAVIGALGLATELPVIIMMSVVLLLDIAILVFSRRRLVCYRCRTSYHDLPLPRYHRSWDRTIAERYAGGRAQPHVPPTGAESETPPPSAPVFIPADTVLPPPRRIGAALDAHPPAQATTQAPTHESSFAWPSSRK